MGRECQNLLERGYVACEGNFEGGLPSTDSVGGIFAERTREVKRQGEKAQHMAREWRVAW